MKLPAGYTPPKETKKDEYGTTDRFDTEDDGSFAVKIHTSTSATFANLKAGITTPSPKVKVVESVDFVNGTGFYYSARNDSDKATFQNSIVKSGDKVIECEARSMDDKPLNPPDACKTLRAL